MTWGSLEYFGWPGRGNRLNNWFQGQMDYIFFFCGLAFIGLGVICYVLSKGGQPAVALGMVRPLFGFAYGLASHTGLRSVLLLYSILMTMLYFRKTPYFKVDTQ